MLQHYVPNSGLEQARPDITHNEHKPSFSNQVVRNDEQVVGSSGLAAWDKNPPIVGLKKGALLGGIRNTGMSVSNCENLFKSGAQDWAFETLNISLDAQPKTCWCFMNPSGRPSYTRELLRDINSLQLAIQSYCLGEMRAGNEHPIQYYVLASQVDGIFNLGGDLALFGRLIREQDRAALRAYAYACIDVLYNNAISFGLPVVTIGLVQGDALGGGFEAALSCNVIIAEKSAKFGLPEIVFNLFPGMGAYTLLRRKLNAATAQRMILSGRLYSADELQEMGIVDVVCDDGKGQEAVAQYIKQNRRRQNALSAICQVAQVAQPLSYAELASITEIWVDTALKVSQLDLRTMERLKSAQDRRIGNNCK